MSTNILIDEIKEPNAFEDEHVHQPYQGIASDFSNSRAYPWPWITDYLSNLSVDSTVLDLGCGNGRNMTGRQKFIGIDMCKEFVNICKSRGLDASVGNMCEIPLADDSVDHIMSIAAFHHLSSTERRIKALLEMKRVVKPKGTVLLSVWSINQPKKTRRVFEEYGDTIVPWNRPGNVQHRYYYIFRLEEIEWLFHYIGATVLSHTWDCGNEVYVLQFD